MPGIYDAPAAVKGIFSLHVVTAGFAFILFLLAITLIVTRLVNGRARSFTYSSGSSVVAPLRTSLATHLFLAPALLCQTIAYAIQSAVVALDTKVRAPAAITSAYAYSYPASSQLPRTTGYAQSLSILSFTFQLASILSTFALTGAVWLHSNNLTNNGTGVSMPRTVSKIWNTFILTAILALGLASWSEGLSVRGSGETALTYPGTMDSPGTTRVLFVVFRIIVIIASTSVSIEVIRNYSNLQKHGIANNKQRPLLARFTFAVVPLIWIRNAFIVVNIVVLHENAKSWSDATKQALAFLFIIFGQLDNLMILFMVLWGAWSEGRSAGTVSRKGASRSVHNDY